MFGEYWQAVMDSTPGQGGGAREQLLAAGAADKVATFGEHIEKLHVSAAAGLEQLQATLTPRHVITHAYRCRDLLLDEMNEMKRLLVCDPATQS